MIDDLKKAERVSELQERYRKEKRVKEYDLSKDHCLTRRIRKRKYLAIDTERCAESLKTDLAADERKMKREAETTEIANKIADGTGLTKDQLAEIEKNPAVRILVKNKLRSRGYETHDIYANALADAYETTTKESTKEEPITEYDRFQNRKLVMQEIKDLEGLKAQPDKADTIPAQINLIVDEGLCVETDGHTVKIHSVPKTETPAPSKKQSEDQDSGVWS